MRSYSKSNILPFASNRAMCGGLFRNPFGSILFGREKTFLKSSFSATRQDRWFDNVYERITRCDTSVKKTGDRQVLPRLGVLVGLVFRLYDRGQPVVPFINNVGWSIGIAPEVKVCRSIINLRQNQYKSQESPQWDWGLVGHMTCPCFMALSVPLQGVGDLSEAQR